MPKNKRSPPIMVMVSLLSAASAISSPGLTSFMHSSFPHLAHCMSLVQDTPQFEVGFQQFTLAPVAQSWLAQTLSCM